MVEIKTDEQLIGQAGSTPEMTGVSIGERVVAELEHSRFFLLSPVYALLRISRTMEKLPQPDRDSAAVADAAVTYALNAMKKMNTPEGTNT